MFFPMETILATVLFCAFLWWAHSDEIAAKKKRQDEDREFELKHQRRELENAKRSAVMWKNLAQGIPDKSIDQRPE